MSYELIMCLVVVLFIIVSMLVVPWLKKKRLWTAALFVVNIAEQICDFFGMRGMGDEKYAFVKRVLLMLNPKLTDDQMKNIIETLVAEMNELKKE